MDILQCTDRGYDSVGGFCRATSVRRWDQLLCFGESHNHFLPATWFNYRNMLIDNLNMVGACV